MAQVLVIDDSTTVRKVVSRVLEDRGHSVIEAVDGEDALSVLADPDFRADVVLVDFVMPKMNGFQFCQKLRADMRLADTPVVLMSAKADRLRDRFMQQTGALDAITKPFDPEALVAVIDQALVRKDRPTKTALDDDLEGEDDSLDDPSSPTLADGTRNSSRTTIDKLEVAAREPLAARLVADQIATAVPEGLLGERTREEFATILATTMGSAMLDGLLRVLSEHVGADLSGRMDHVPFGAVLQMLSMEQRSGVLTCEHEGGRITITLREGLVDLARSQNTRDEFRLGRYFLERGVLDQSQLDSALVAVPDDSRPAEDVRPPAHDTAEQLSHPLLLGDRLRAKSLVTEEQLLAALSRQSSELVYEVLRWTRGRFTFAAGDVDALAARAELSLPMAQVVMEGFRRVDEWRALEQALGDFSNVLARDDLAVTRLRATELPSDERAVLEAVDGRRTIREVIIKSHLSSFDACRVLVQLLEARLVRRRFG